MIYQPTIELLKHFCTINSCNLFLLRTIMAASTTFAISLVFGKKFINFSRKKFQNSARPFTPESHQLKGKTPTMGGIFIVFTTIANMALWCNWNTPEPHLITLTLILFGGIGLLDDLNKAWYKKGISAGLKFRLQLTCALIVATAWIWLKNPTLAIFAPIFRGVNIDLGSMAIPLIILWVIFIIVGTTNAVNLTDGLDGLAIGSLILNFSFFGIVAYLAGQTEMASSLHIPFANCSELIVIAAILTAASLGFYWFNRHPAQIFMGDVGSLSLGAALAMMAIITRQEILLAISGGIFALEALSVMGQIFSIKVFGKKLLCMAPLHHHFEMQGWPESKVTARFHTITLILCFCAAMVLKIRQILLN